MDDSALRLRGAPRRACDNCRQRKIRCNRELPCDRCLDISLVCLYNDIARRKGPKGRKVPVLTSLCSTVKPDSSSTLTHDSQFIQNVSSEMSPPSLASLDAGLCSAYYEVSLLLSEVFPAAPSPVPRRISSLQLQAYVQVFMRYLYPIMPVVDKNALLLDCTNSEALETRRYALLVALSAATHIQLNLDFAQGIAGVSLLPSGQTLVSEALQALRQIDPLDDPHVDTLLTVFFLFAAYGNLCEQHRAWHFLNQSISFLYMLQLNMESTYMTLNQDEAETLRRIYWLLFITERAYALQTTRPIMLRATIQKPAVFRSDSPVTMYGLSSLISLFGKISPDLYEWNICDVGEPYDMSSIANMYKSIAFASPLLAEASETSQVDFILTQQWLQTCLWRLYVDQRYLCQARSNTDLPTKLPAMAGKSVLACLSSVAQKSTDAHGIEAVCYVVPFIYLSHSPTFYFHKRFL
ncbi:hypothetical protein BGW36DRAFT_452294 [Talaromyces proteolyticus]|uniref:Zn(2)-C6 fungal-type domain-containing protein n=1 Tax=Talaromyces proteolyticus TaxID=1131652 RepID=A0AAD4KV28_9EURO|nr:uncharacterized protein BGW36DRAFT_452294 [Talaromyces proteolyticus]KAH8696584.1 hypothetical protein BGW36DRAFT_452294 [Talaromyces proteolyticus]